MSLEPGHGVLRDRAVRDWALATGVSRLGDQVWLVALAWTSVRLGASLIVQAGALASLGVDPLVPAAVATLTVGLTAGFASPLLAGAFQQTVPGGYLGRCGSLVALSDAALLPLALVGFGWLGAHAGVGVACGLFGAGFAALLGYSTLRTGPRAGTQPASMSGTS